MEITDDLSVAEVPLATRRDWLGLGVIALPCLLYSMDLTVLHLAVPHLGAQLQPTATQLLWIVDIYGFLLAGLLIPMGTLGDRIGRRRLLVWGAAGFGAASLLAAFSGTAAMLIVARALLGIAGATLAPSTLSLIRNMFQHRRQRTVAIGVWGGCFALGTALGPIVGGALLEFFWWGSVFLLAVPIMILVLIMAPLLPEFRDARAGSLDLTSSMLATAAVLAVVYGIKRAADDGPDAWALIVTIVGAFIGLFFAQRQRRLAEPLIDLRMFRNAAFSTALAASTVGLFAAQGSLLFVTQYLQLVCDMSPLQAGLWLAPTGIAHLVSALLTPALARRLQPHVIMTAGFVVMATGYGALTQVSEQGTPELVMTGVVLFVVGLVPMLTVGTDMVMSAVPSHKAGAASGISETSAELGAALGIGVLGSLAMTVYRVRLNQAALPGLPPDAIAIARETATAAMSVAKDLPGESATRLLTAAREGLTNSVRVIAAANLALAALAAYVCSRCMKTS